MPVNDASGGPRGQRPKYQPRSAARVRYYKASMILAIVFLALVVVLPVWLDLLRRAEDREALQRPLESRAVLSGSTPLPEAASAPRPEPARRRSDVVNTDCRGHVYARCNALRISPRDCIEIAARAVEVPPEDGHEACLAVVEPLLTARAEDGTPAPARATTPTPTRGDEVPAGAETGATTPQAPSGNPEATPDDAAPAGSPGEGATGEAPAAPVEEAAPGEAPGKEPPTSAATPGEGAGTTGPELTPAERAQHLARMQTLIDEFQRGANNYATPPAVQAARMAELRTLVDDLGTDDAKALYNRMIDTYRMPRTQVPVAPEVGNYVGDAQRVEVGVTERSPTTTPELDAVGKWADTARREAGLPAAAPAPRPDQAVAPTSSVGSEVPTTTVGSTAPASAGFVESITP